MDEPTGGVRGIQVVAPKGDLRFRRRAGVFLVVVVEHDNRGGGCTDEVGVTFHDVDPDRLGRFDLVIIDGCQGDRNLGAAGRQHDLGCCSAVIGAELGVAGELELDR